MRAARLYGKEDLRVEEVPTPRPGPGEVVVRVRAATTCGTDLKVFLRGAHAKMLRLPSLFGHEGSGEIAAVGKEARNFKEGDRVVWNNSAPCGSCRYCRVGEPSLCEDILFVNGTYAEYILLPARIVSKNLLPLPADLPFDLASMTEPLACALHGAGKIVLEKGQTAVLLGDGSIGLYFVLLARLQGVRLYVIGGSKDRLAKARELGAAGTLDRHFEKREATAWLADQMGGSFGPDVVIEAVGTPEAWDDAVRIVRPGGKVLLFGGCARDTFVTFPTERLHYDALTLVGVFHNTPAHVREALAILSSPEGRALATLLAPPVPIEGVNDALRRMQRREAIKVPVQP